jgi:hypothetical protein
MEQTYPQTATYTPSISSDSEGCHHPGKFENKAVDVAEKIKFTASLFNGAISICAMHITSNSKRCPYSCLNGVLWTREPNDGDDFALFRDLEFFSWRVVSRCWARRLLKMFWELILGLNISSWL